jgi:cell division protein FtsI/penicillin-binding protein 2
MMDKAFQRRAFFICLALVAGLSALSIRLIYLQVLSPRLSENRSVPRFKLKEKIPAMCGMIVDRNQTVVVGNQYEAALIADLYHLEAIDILIPALARREAQMEPEWDTLDEDGRTERLLQLRRKIRRVLPPQKIIEAHLDYAAEVIAPRIHMGVRDFRDLVTSGRKRVVVKKGLEMDLADQLEEALQARLIQGFSFERSQQRYYRRPTLASHLVGFRDHSGRGVSGIERSMYEVLAGRDGERVLKRDENGLVNLTEPAEVTPPKMGKHVRLTLDMGMQEIIEEELGETFEKLQAVHGSIVVVDPHTGDILAMASRPHFNLNKRQNYEHAGFNFAVSGQYESGSVMKIVPMAAALDRGVATRDSVVHCGWGLLKGPGYKVKDHTPFGELSFDMVMMKSSNCGTFRFGYEVGQSAFYEVLDNFGFGKKTFGEDNSLFPWEAEGKISNRSNTQNFASATYGYGVSVTPLQLAMAYSVLANGGTLLQPRLVDAIIASNGTVLERTPVRQVRRVIRKDTARQMRLVLEKVVLEGTGWRAQVPGYRVGGKTGTALKWDHAENDYSRDPRKRFLTFAGLMPVDDPKFVCVVTIHEPTNLEGIEKVGGGRISAPVFADVAGRLARYMNLPPELDPLAQHSDE